METSRDRLVTAMSDLMWERGYAATSPREVRERSGVGQGGMYHCFSGKHALALAALERNCADLLPGVPHWRMLTLPDLKPKAALETALNHCRVAYGPTLRAALMAFNGDGGKLLERVLAETPSHALVEAGVLTVDHG